MLKYPKTTIYDTSPIFTGIEVDLKNEETLKNEDDLQTGNLKI